MNIKRNLFIFLLAGNLSLFAKDHNIMEYGAVSDTTVLSTRAIQSAIDACSEEGGGTKTQLSRPVPEKEKEYPEAEMFGVLPSYGFFIRHARNIHFSNIQLQTGKEDSRLALYLSDLSDAGFTNLNLGSSPNDTCNIFMEKCQNIAISNSKIRGVSNCFLLVSGNENKGIVLINNILFNAKKLYLSEPSAKKEIHESGNIR